MEKVFQRLVETNFSELTGLTVDASVPVPERLINEIIQGELDGNKNVTYCRLSIERQNRVDVQLKTTFWPWPLNLKLKLFGSIDFTNSVIVRAFLENNVLLGKLGSLLKALPPGVNIYNNQVSIDLGEFLKDPEQKRFLSLIKAGDIKTEVGKLILKLKIEN